MTPLINNFHLCVFPIILSNSPHPEEKPGSFVQGMEMLHAASPFCVVRVTGIWSGLSLGHLLLPYAEAEALEVGSLPGHKILHFFCPKLVP